MGLTKKYRRRTGEYTFNYGLVHIPNAGNPGNADNPGNPNKLTKKHKKNINNLKQFNGGSHSKWDYLPLETVNTLEKLAEYYNVSHKARGLQKPTKSDKGFLEIYRQYKGIPSKFESLPVRENKPRGENWQHHRDNFCNRRYSMIKGHNRYGLYDKTTGLPTVMHTNMIMWACSPDYKNIIKNANNIVKKIPTK